MGGVWGGGTHYYLLLISVQSEVWIRYDPQPGGAPLVVVVVVVVVVAWPPPAVHHIGSTLHSELNLKVWRRHRCTSQPSSRSKPEHAEYCKTLQNIAKCFAKCEMYCKMMQNILQNNAKYCNTSVKYFSTGQSRSFRSASSTAKERRRRKKGFLEILENVFAMFKQKIEVRERCKTVHRT